MAHTHMHTHTHTHTNLHRSICSGFSCMHLCFSFAAAVTWGHVMGAAEFMMTWTYAASAFGAVSCDAAGVRGHEGKAGE